MKFLNSLFLLATEQEDHMTEIIIDPKKQVESPLSNNSYDLEL